MTKTASKAFITKGLDYSRPNVEITLDQMFWIRFGFSGGCSENKRGLPQELEVGISDVERWDAPSTPVPTFAARRKLPSASSDTGGRFLTLRSASGT